MVHGKKSYIKISDVIVYYKYGEKNETVKKYSAFTTCYIHT